MQSAEEFATFLEFGRFVPKNIDAGAKAIIADSTCAIRARDREVANKSFDLLDKIGSGYTIICCQKVTREDFVDSVLRDLG